MQAGAPFAAFCGRLVIVPVGLTSPTAFSTAVTAILAADGLRASLSELSVDDELLSKLPSLQDGTSALQFDASLETPHGSTEDADSAHLYPSQTVMRAFIGVCDASAHSEGQMSHVCKEFPLDAARSHKHWGSPASTEPIARLFVFGATEHHLEHSTFFGQHVRFVMHPLARQGAHNEVVDAPVDNGSDAPLTMHLRLEMSQIHSMVLREYGAELAMFHKLEEGGPIGAHLAASASESQPSHDSAGDMPLGVVQPTGMLGSLSSFGSSMGPASLASLLGASASPVQLAAISGVRCGRLDVGIGHGLGSVSAAFGALRRRLNGRLAKHRAGLLLLMGCPAEAVEAAERACRALRGSGDLLFACLAEETRAAALQAQRAQVQPEGELDGDVSAYDPAVAGALREAVAHIDALAASLGLGAASTNAASANAAASASASSGPTGPEGPVGEAPTLVAGGSLAATAVLLASNAVSAATSAAIGSVPRETQVLCDFVSQLVVSTRIRLASYLLTMAAPPQPALRALCGVSGASADDGGLLSWWAANGRALSSGSPSSLRLGSAAAAHERSRADATLLAITGGEPPQLPQATGSGFGSGKDGDSAAVAAAVFVAQRTANAVRVELSANEIARSVSSIRKIGASNSSEGADGTSPVGDGSGAAPGATAPPPSGATGGGPGSSLREFNAKLGETMRKADSKLSETMRKADAHLTSAVKKASAAASAAAHALPSIDQLPSLVGGKLGAREARPGPLDFAEALTAAVARAPGIRSPHLQSHALLLAADIYETSGLWRRADACVARACRLLRLLQSPLAPEAFSSPPGSSLPPSGGCIYTYGTVAAVNAATSAANSPAAASNPSVLPWPLPWLHGLDAANRQSTPQGLDAHARASTRSLHAVAAASAPAQSARLPGSAAAPSSSAGLLIGPGWLRFRPCYAAALLTLTSSLRDPALLARLLPLQPGERVGPRFGGSRDSGPGSSGPRVLLPASGLAEWGPQVVSDLWQCGELPLALAVTSMLSDLTDITGGTSGWGADQPDMRLPSSTGVLRGRAVAASSEPVQHVSSEATPSAHAALALARLAPTLRNRRALASAARLSLCDASPLVVLRAVLNGTVVRGRMSRLDALCALQLLGSTAAEAGAAALHMGAKREPASPVPAPASSLRLDGRPMGLLSALASDLCCVPQAAFQLGTGDGDLAQLALAESGPQPPVAGPAGGQQAWKPLAFAQALATYMLGSGSASAGAPQLPHAHGGGLASGALLLQQRLVQGGLLTRPLYVPPHRLPLVRVTSLALFANGGGVHQQTVLSPQTSPRPNATGSTTMPAYPATAQQPVCIAEYVPPPWTATALSKDSQPRATREQSSMACGKASSSTTILVDSGEGRQAPSRPRMMMDVDGSRSSTASTGAAERPAPLASRAHSVSCGADARPLLYVALSLRCGGCGPVTGSIAVQAQVAWVPSNLTVIETGVEPTLAPVETSTSFVPFSVQSRGVAQVMLPLSSLPPPPAPPVIGSNPACPLQLLFKVTGVVCVVGSLIQQQSILLQASAYSSDAVNVASSAKTRMTPRGPGDDALPALDWDLDLTFAPAAVERSYSAPSSASGGSGGSHAGMASARRGSAAATMSPGRASASAPVALVACAPAEAATPRTVGIGLPPEMGGSVMHSTRGVAVFGSSWATTSTARNRGAARRR